MDGTKITRQKHGWRVIWSARNVSPKTGELNGRHENNSPKLRMENQIVSTKITHPRVGQYKNNSPKGWMGGELYGRRENNSSKTGELNGRHENKLPKG